MWGEPSGVANEGGPVSWPAGYFGPSREGRLDPAKACRACFPLFCRMSFDSMGGCAQNRSCKPLQARWQDQAGRQCLCTSRFASVSLSWPCFYDCKRTVTSPHRLDGQNSWRRRGFTFLPAMHAQLLWAHTTRMRMHVRAQKAHAFPGATPGNMGVTWSLSKDS